MTRPQEPSRAARVAGLSVRPGRRPRLTCCIRVPVRHGRVAELRQSPIRYLRRAQRDERLVVTDRNRPVAGLGPPPKRLSTVWSPRVGSHARPAEASRSRSSSTATPTLSVARSPRSAPSADDSALFYADSSALVKLLGDEPESAPSAPSSPTPTSSRASSSRPRCPARIRRAVAHDPRLPLDLLLARAGEPFDAVGSLPLDRPLLLAAGAVAEPALRALDAIHVAAAVDRLPFDAFVTCDDRQAATARLAGLRTMQPGA